MMIKIVRYTCSEIERCNSIIYLAFSLLLACAMKLPQMCVIQKKNNIKNNNNKTMLKYEKERMGLYVSVTYQVRNHIVTGSIMMFRIQKYCLGNVSVERDRNLLHVILKTQIQKCNKVKKIIEIHLWNDWN